MLVPRRNGVPQAGTGVPLLIHNFMCFVFGALVFFFISVCPRELQTAINRIGGPVHGNL